MADRMPNICCFAGIVILVYYNDHDQPHIKARYARVSMHVTINPVGVLNRSFPDAQKAQVMA
jgi:hypothetical protein